MFFINDNPQILDMKNRPRPVRWNKSLSQVVIIEKNGEIQRKLISDVPGNMLNNSFFELLPDNRVLTRYSSFRKYDKSTYKILDLNRILAQ